MKDNEVDEAIRERILEIWGDNTDKEIHTEILRLLNEHEEKQK